MTPLIMTPLTPLTYFTTKLYTSFTTHQTTSTTTKKNKKQKKKEQKHPSPTATTFTFSFSCLSFVPVVFTLWTTNHNKKASQSFWQQFSKISLIVANSPLPHCKLCNSLFDNGPNVCIGLHNEYDQSKINNQQNSSHPFCYFFLLSSPPIPS